STGSTARANVPGSSKSATTGNLICSSGWIAPISGIWRGSAAATPKARCTYSWTSQIAPGRWPIHGIPAILTPPGGMWRKAAGGCWRRSRNKERTEKHGRFYFVLSPKGIGKPGFGGNVLGGLGGAAGEAHGAYGRPFRDRA